VSGSDGRAEIDASASKGVLVGDHGIQQNFFGEQQAAAAAPVALAQLPPLAAGFTGRQTELAQAAELLDPSGENRELGVVVSAVAGLAGVGKTALAVHAAHAARQAGWFAGGVLFIDLHGYDENPVQSAQALDALLRALGVPGEHIPDGAEQRAGLYRSALAQLADPVLVIADNASSEAQVRRRSSCRIGSSTMMRRGCSGCCPSMQGLTCRPGRRRSWPAGRRAGHGRRSAGWRGRTWSSPPG
jgi:hypothetical protein